MSKTRISIAMPDIVGLFDSQIQRIFELSDLRAIYSENRRFWRLATNFSCNKFIEYLTKHSKLSKETFNFSYRPITKYTWGKVPLYELLLSIKPKAYYSHFSAIFFHELTEQIPKTFYINFEQEKKSKQMNILEQGRIDFAFNHNTRLSKNIAEYNNYTIRLLNGMFTDTAGVIETELPEGAKIRLTDVERTLIDIAVRPEYAGGPFEVLKAYRIAAKKVSVNRLSALLKKIGYVYPYHQVIGFYLDASGCYNESQINLMKQFKITHKFYLMHHMEEKSYDEKWSLYYPKNFR